MKCLCLDLKTEQCLQLLSLCKMMIETDVPVLFLWKEEKLEQQRSRLFIQSKSHETVLVQKLWIFSTASVRIKTSLVKKVLTFCWQKCLILTDSNFRILHLQNFTNFYALLVITIKHYVAHKWGHDEGFFQPCSQRLVTNLLRFKEPVRAETWRTFKQAIVGFMNVCSEARNRESHCYILCSKLKFSKWLSKLVGFLESP